MHPAWSQSGLALKKASIFSLSFVATVFNSSRNCSGVLADEDRRRDQQQVGRAAVGQLEVHGDAARIVLLAVGGHRVAAAEREAPDQRNRSGKVRRLAQRCGFSGRRETAFDADALGVGGAHLGMRAEHPVQSVDEILRLRLLAPSRARRARPSARAPHPSSVKDRINVSLIPAGGPMDPGSLDPIRCP